MSHPIASPLPAHRERDAAVNHDPDLDRGPEPSKRWALLEALAYAGAFIDPTGVLAVQRLRQASEDAEQQRHARR